MLFILSLAALVVLAGKGASQTIKRGDPCYFLAKTPAHGDNYYPDVTSCSAGAIEWEPPLQAGGAGGRGLRLSFLLSPPQAFTFCIQGASENVMLMERESKSLNMLDLPPAFQESPHPKFHCFSSLCGDPLQYELRPSNPSVAGPLVFWWRLDTKEELPKHCNKGLPIRVDAARTGQEQQPANDAEKYRLRRMRREQQLAAGKKTADDAEKD